MANDRNSPATKGDVQDLAEQLRSEIKQNTGQLRAEMKQNTEQLRAEFQHSFDDLKESIRDTQTEVLRAFYGYIQTTEIKLKNTESGEVALRERVSILESRLLEVERRLNLPPRP
jgi:DNA anti-recombination protein RmuC